MKTFLTVLLLAVREGTPHEIRTNHDGFVTREKFAPPGDKRPNAK